VALLNTFEKQSIRDGLGGEVQFESQKRSYVFRYE